MPASFLRSSEYTALLSVQTGFVRNSVFISSKAFRSSSVFCIFPCSVLLKSENSIARLTPPLIDFTFEFSSWLRLSMISLLKGSNDWSIFHEIRLENAMSVLS